MSSSDRATDTSLSPTLDIVGYFTGDIGVELIGTASALRGLAEAIVSSRPSQMYALAMPQAVSPLPYDGFLTALRIIRDDKSVDIYRNGTVLVISGSGENRSTLAANIHFVADQADMADTPMKVQPHLHIEYYPDHLYLARSALPLVVSVEIPNSAGGTITEWKRPTSC